MPTNRNVIYLIVGVLAITTAVLGYQLYQEKKEPKGVQINVGPGGISMEKK
jgi:predicted negative regulator of RcsB-dependent stress response